MGPIPRQELHDNTYLDQQLNLAKPLILLITQMCLPCRARILSEIIDQIYYIKKKIERRGWCLSMKSLLKLNELEEKEEYY
ncbi:unnamed protein product [Paramecium octaurelia]|uniref:Uncharacterized protein n=1 Tax=Paramecium octaurelia TaxID=43137 RepID=A0A8S1SU10_PAROT|nr:unnamed protein product [Paramecium octaurelia]